MSHVLARSKQIVFALNSITTKKKKLIAVLGIIALALVVLRVSSTSVLSGSPSSENSSAGSQAVGDSAKADAVIAKDRAAFEQLFPSFAKMGKDNGGSRPSLRSRWMNLLSPAVPMITVSKTDALAVDVDMDNQADPGDTLMYTVTITNSGGMDATNVMFSDTIDPNTTLVMGSVAASPIAVNDTYQTIGNVNISVPMGTGLLANDLNPNGSGTLTVTAFDATSTNGGAVAVNADGSFTYNPAAGFHGPTDTFTYTLGNGTGKTDTATVTININGLIWFVDDDAASGGDGRLTTPFNCLVGTGCFDPTAADIAGDNIFLYSGNYTGGLTLLNTQRLIGQGAGQSILTITGLSAPSGNNLLPATGGTDPLITTAGATAITLGQGNGLHGFTVGNTTATGTDIAGTSFGTLTVRDVTLNGTGRALNLMTGTLMSGSTFDTIESSGGSPAEGIRLNAVGGSFTATTTNIVNPTGTGIDVQSSPSGASFSFGNTTVNKNSTNGTGINLSSNSGTFSFSSLAATTNNGTGLSASSSGTVNVTTGSITSTGGPGLSISSTAAGMTFTSVSSTNSSSTGISLTSVSGSLMIGTTTVTNPTSQGISAATSSGTVNFGNTAANSSGGTGIFLNNNTGTFTFGDLDIAPDTNQRGLHATDNSNTITSTSGTISTTGAAAVEITRASMTTPLAISLTSVSANGGANGIILTNTSGSFTITGNGMDMTLGGNGTGGTITGMTNAGINLTGVTNISLTSMLIQNGGDDGIRGMNVNGFTFNRNRVLNNGDAVLERGIDMTNLLGTSSITNSLVTGNAEDNLYVKNGTGTLNLTTTGTTYANNSAMIGNDGIHFLAADVSGSNNANMSITVMNCIFTNNRGDHFQALTDAVSSATQTVIFQNNDLNNTVGTNLGAGLTLNPGGTATVNFNISNNGTGADPFTGAFSSAITINSSNSSTMSGTISNNVIGNPAVTDSGSFSGDGITVFANNTSDITIAITNNSIREYSNLAGINIHVRDGASDTINATITGNTISDPGTFASNGILAQAGSVAGDTGFLCLDIGGAGALANSIAGSGANGGDDFRVRQRILTTVRLPGYAGANNDNAAVVGFIQGRNTGIETGSATNNVAGGGGGFVGGAACASPALGPVMESATSSPGAEMLTTENEDSQPESVLWATRGENKNTQNIVKLTPSEVSAMAQAAIARWAEAGVSAKNLSRLQSLTFEIADLPDGQLATAEGLKITLDETAAGYGWFFDATPSDDNEFRVPVINRELQTTELSDAIGRMDLLTVLMRQLGSRVNHGKASLKGPHASLMENTLDTGTRRAPAFRVSTIGKAPAVPDAKAKPIVAGKPQRRSADNQQVASLTTPRNSRVNKHHATLTPRAAASASMADVMLNLGTLPAGESITIMFNVTVNNPFVGASNQVCNQGTVTADGGINVLTDDPGVGGTADPTCTPIDQPDVTVAVAPSSVLEDGMDNLVYTFTREGGTGSDLTVNFNVGGTATFNTDYTQSGAATFAAMSGTVVIPMGSSTAMVTVDPTADMTVEPDETVILTVASGTGYDVGMPSSATGTINNDDTDVSVAVSPLAVDEDGGTNLVYTFTRVGVTAGALTANFSIGGSATDDYTQSGAATFTPPTGTVMFGAGSSTAMVTIDPTADMTVEPDETVILTVEPGTGYNVAAMNSSATGTITNDDTDVSVEVSPLSVDEDGATNLVYTFTRVGVTSGSLTVNFTIDGTATFSSDYSQMGAASFVPPNGTVMFGAGNSTATVTVDPTSDMTPEPDETVIFTVAAGTGYNVGSPSSATGTILNDDTLVSVAVSPTAVDEDGMANLVYTFTRTDSAGALTINFNVGGTATFNTDYTQSGADTFSASSGTLTFADASSTAMVTVDPTADMTVEPDETVMLTVAAGMGYGVGMPSSATGTITNDDTDVSVAVSPSAVDEDGGTNLVYTFTRVGVTAGALTVNFSIGGTAIFNDDYTESGAATFTPPTGTVMFGAGSSTAMVTIDPSTDTTVEPDETVILTVEPGDGYKVAAMNSSATGTITNDDTDVSIAVSPSSVLEDGATNLVYTFTRVGVTGSALTVNFTIGGTATFPGDYTEMGAATFMPPSGTVMFVAGNSTTTVTVDPSPDMIAEPDETVILTLASGTGYNVGSPDSATGTILNDDAVDVEITAKTDTPDPVCVGQNITYTIGFRNNGPAAATNAKVSDAIPANTTFVSATLPMGWSRADSVVAGGTGTLMFTRASVANGETASFQVVVNVNNGTTSGTIISNTATASSDFPDDVPSNNSKTAMTTVDPTPPMITGLSANPASLWPPNHKMRDVAINYTATDNCPGAVSCMITDISSNQPINGTGDGDTAPDWEFVDEHNVRLRAETAGGSTGRIYTITVKCTDAAGNMTTSTVEVHVGHNITSPASGSAFKINTPVTFSGTFWDIPGRTHTAQWQFDSLITGATLTEPAGSNNGTVRGTYTFREPGVYKVTLKVTDNTGLTSWVDTQDDLEAIVVIYDPNGGYTMGGGWITSPAGSYVADPSLTGKLNFGFDSKYKNATNPKGETLVKFRLGDLEFSALNYDYLAISKARAQFRGFGKINGSAGYDFILTVIDGDAAGGGGVDRFRIKIWNKITGAIVYDNQIGASDAADPITPVGSNSSITVKK